MAKKQRMVTAVFRNRVDADRAFDRLLGMGYLESEVNVLMSDTTRANYYATAAGTQGKKETKHTAGTHAAEGLGVGGAIGTVTGAAIAAALAIGTQILIPIPGSGVVALAGPLAAALAGGGAGAVTGGVIGALVGLGIPEQNAKAYDEILRDGGVALGVVPHSNDDGSEIEKIFKEHNGENVIMT